MVDIPLVSTSILTLSSDILTAEWNSDRLYQNPFFDYKVSFLDSQFLVSGVEARVSSKPKSREFQTYFSYYVSIQHASVSIGSARVKDRRVVLRVRKVSPRDNSFRVKVS